MATRKIDGLTEDEFDTLTLVLGLVQHGWSYSKIGRVIDRSHNTVKVLHDKALQLKADGKLTKTATSERSIRIDYVGGTQELEGIERAQIELQSGRRPTGHKADD